MEEVKSKKAGGRMIWVIILLIAVGLVFLWQTGKLGATGTTNSNKYQAVFLTNNQVYFGKLSNAASQYPVLRQVYYLQVTQTLQPKDQNAQPINNINLVKLGGEIHGPADEMVINRDHILFYEDLKDDSQVVKAINDFKAKQGK